MARRHKDRKASASSSSGGVPIPVREPTTSDSRETIQEDCNVKDKGQNMITVHKKESSVATKPGGSPRLPPPARTHIQHVSHGTRLPLQPITNRERPTSLGGTNARTVTSTPDTRTDTQRQAPDVSLESKLSHIAKTLHRELERTLTSGRIKNRQRGVFRRAFEQVNEAARMMDGSVTSAQQRLAKQVRSVMVEVGALLLEYGDMSRAAQENRPLTFEVAGRLGVKPGGNSQ